MKHLTKHIILALIPVGIALAQTNQDVSGDADTTKRGPIVVKFETHVGAPNPAPQTIDINVWATCIKTEASIEESCVGWLAAAVEKIGYKKYRMTIQVNTSSFEPGIYKGRIFFACKSDIVPTIEIIEVIVTVEGQIPERSWGIIYDTEYSDEANYIQQTSDGGYILTGTTSAFRTSGDPADIMVLKLDYEGDIEWGYLYCKKGVDEGCSIQETDDGGFILAGFTSADPFRHLWILRLSPNGSVGWQREYNLPAYLSISIQQTTDRGYIVAGWKYGERGQDAFVMKLDGAGLVEWGKTYGGLKDDIACSIEQTSDEGYILVGSTQSFQADSIWVDSDIWVLKLDKNGNIDWSLTCGNEEDDTASCVQQTSDGGYILTGCTVSALNKMPEVIVLKLKPSGSKEWERSYSPGLCHHQANCIAETSDGKYVVVGWSQFALLRSNLIVLKIEPNDGSVIWGRMAGGENSDKGRWIQQTSDNGYIITGYTEPFEEDERAVWVLKLNKDGNIPECEVIEEIDNPLNSVSGVSVTSVKPEVKDLEVTVTSTDFTTSQDVSMKKYTCP